MASLSQLFCTAPLRWTSSPLCVKLCCFLSLQQQQKYLAEIFGIQKFVCRTKSIELHTSAWDTYPASWGFNNVILYLHKADALQCTVGKSCRWQMAPLEMLVASKNRRWWQAQLNVYVQCVLLRFRENGQFSFMLKIVHRSLYSCHRMQCICLYFRMYLSPLVP